MTRIGGIAARLLRIVSGAALGFAIGGASALLIREFFYKGNAANTEWRRYAQIVIISMIITGVIVGAVTRSRATIGGMVGIISSIVTSVVMQWGNTWVIVWCLAVGTHGCVSGVVIGVSMTTGAKLLESLGMLKEERGRE